MTVRGTAARLLLAGALVGCGAEEPSILGLEPGEGPVAIEVVVSHAPVEGAHPDPFGPPHPTLGQVLRRLQEAADEPRVRGLLLRLAPIDGAWGRWSDIATALGQVRAEGKPVHCHFEQLGNVGYALLASSCDRISMTPAGHLELVGPAIHTFYARTLLEHVGLEAELLEVGRYKGAADPLTLDEMPEETRESLGAILDGLHGSLVEAIAKGRDLEGTRVRRVIDEGPYGSHRARQAELVDDVGFDDEAREHLRRAAEVERVHTLRVGPEREELSLGDLLRALSGEAPTGRPEGPRLAVVLLEGTIATGEQEAAVQGTHSGPFVRTLRRMADDDDVRAVVLRIDSPGGSALASDRMWHAVRRVAKRKPVIASIGDMAASGGYYVASAAREILAHETSLVGSIGVVGGKIHAAELADRVGVNVVVLARGRHADWASLVTPLDPDERDTLEGLLRSTYRRFLRRVQTGRDMDLDKVMAAAEGRLMTGTHAQELGLVDELAGLGEALQRARQAGDLPEDAPIERWPPRRTLLDALASRLGGGAGAGELLRGTGAGTHLPAEGIRLLEAGRVLAREKVAACLPFVLRVE